MKKIVIFYALALLCCACGTIKYVPIESVRTEYRNTATTDSIYLRDSIFIKEKGDTLIVEKYRYLYRDRILRDSIFKTDTIRIPYPVEVVKDVKKAANRLAEFSSMVRADFACFRSVFAFIFCTETKINLMQKSRRKRFFSCLKNPKINKKLLFKSFL